MFSTVRRYLGVSSELAAELERREADLTEVMRSVPGLLSYQLVRTREGMFAVTVCGDEASAIEVNRRAVAWLRIHVPAFTQLLPEVWSGPVVFCIETKAK